MQGQAQHHWRQGDLHTQTKGRLYEAQQQHSVFYRLCHFAGPGRLQKDHML
jgi:hypothetical protein